MAYHAAMRFAAPWDRTLRVSTAVVGLALVAVAAFLVRLGAATETTGATALTALVVAVLASTLGLAWALAPKGFSIEAGRLRVERPLLPIDVPLAAIRAAGALPDGTFRGSLRLAGSSGLFGYYGRFWNRRLGAFRAYATRRTGLVLVEAAAGRFVLSPEPPDRFLDALLSRSPAASRAVPEAPLAPRPTPRGMKIGLALLAALAPLLMGGAALAVWAWSPRAARVEGGEIRIERKLAPAAVIPLPDVRRVERIPLVHGERLGRVAGTAVPGGVRYGHFRSSELGDVELYAWRPGPYVLLETSGGRVVVTPDDADGFVAAVRAALPRR